MLTTSKGWRTFRSRKSEDKTEEISNREIIPIEEEDNKSNTIDESNEGKVTSLWECCEMIGGYIGSLSGGIASDLLGFRAATNIMVIVETVILATLILYCLVNDRRR